MALKIVDSYSESNQDDYSNVNIYNLVGQSFTGDGGVLNKISVYSKKVGSPTGNVTVRVYAHTGTYGTSSKATGSVLAESENVDISTISTSFGLVDFTFSGANKITLSNGTNYVLLVYYWAGNISNNITVGYDYGSSTHDGNLIFWYNDIDDQYSDTSGDLCFYVYADSGYGVSPSPLPTHFNL